MVWTEFSAIGEGYADAPSAPLEGRPGQGRSREPSREGPGGEPYLVCVHARNVQQDAPRRKAAEMRHRRCNLACLLICGRLRAPLLQERTILLQCPYHR